MNHLLATAVMEASPIISTPPPEGCLDVLNCGLGHLSFRFDKSDPDQTTKAKRVIGDMLKRGYMLFALVDGEQKRIRKFDADREEYILEEPDVISEPVSRIAESPPPAPRGRGRPPGKRVSMRTTKATGIGPSAGG